jgi:hypothetical protein
MTGDPSDDSLFPSFTLPTPTILTMGDLQQPIQFPQSGFSPRDMGTGFLLIDI